TPTRCASRLASWRGSRRSTSPRWSGCGCTPSRSHAATRSCSNRPDRTPPRRCGAAGCGRRAGRPAAASTAVPAANEPSLTRLTHPAVAAVSFVGSTPIARYVHDTASAHGKRVQALGGAKNHAVVLPDADLELAADGLVSAGYGSAGQRCMAVSVAVAVGDVA